MVEADAREVVDLSATNLMRALRLPPPPEGGNANGTGVEVPHRVEWVETAAGTVEHRELRLARRTADFSEPPPFFIQAILWTRQDVSERTLCSLEFSLDRTRGCG